MAVAPRLEEHLHRSGIAAEVLTHALTPSASRTAQACHVPGDQLAKGVLFEDGAGYLLAVLPASHHVEIDQITRLCGRPLSLAGEDQISRLFPDCEIGAIPPLGTAYGLPMLVEDVLACQADVYLEAGDHVHVLHVTGEQFARLTEGSQRGRFSRHD